MSSVRTARRSHRNLAYIAGMTWDLAIMLSCLGLQLGGLDWQLTRTIVYTLTLSLIFQFSVFMRTDVYYVLANWLRLGNLMDDTRHLLANLLCQMAGRGTPYDLSAVPAREMRIIRWYLPYHVLGSTAVTVACALLTIPALFQMIKIAISGVTDGPQTVGFWDGLGFLALVVCQFGALAFVIVTERLEPRRRP